MTPAQQQRATAARTLGQRLRRRRLEAGLTAQQAAQNAGTTQAAWSMWEVGRQPYPLLRLSAIAAAIGVPVAALLTDRFVLAEIQVSDESLERIRREGRSAAVAIVAAIVPSLEATLLAEATRPAIDLSPGARARPRRSREQLLAAKANGIAAAERGRRRA